MRHLIAWLATLGIGLTGFAQTQSLSFEVATLKINKSGSGNVAFGCYDPESQRVPTNVLVVDHIERPSEIGMKVSSLRFEAASIRPLHLFRNEE